MSQRQCSGTGDATTLASPPRNDLHQAKVERTRGPLGRRVGAGGVSESATVEDDLRSVDAVFRSGLGVLHHLYQRRDGIECCLFELVPYRLPVRGPVRLQRVLEGGVVVDPAAHGLTGHTRELGRLGDRSTCEQCVQRAVLPRRQVSTRFVHTNKSSTGAVVAV